MSAPTTDEVTLSGQVEAPPPDVETMREAVNRLLDPDAVAGVLPLPDEEIETLTLQITGHLAVIMPEVERTAVALNRQSIPRYCALACLGEAKMKLGEKPSAQLPHARRLARVLNALCDHFETLTGSDS
ncbi:DUF6415 family natural product biosynthesis protein [Streptomyces sp. NPDC090075]|uniref:DUF6415 family natural product biosynthesis protein n=1 Tax=Streptomyces sp. NPDC090075 TaxID=3365937 RepID=UPI003828FEF9